MRKLWKKWCAWLLFDGLLRKWNAFSPIALPEEAKRYAEECMAQGIDPVFLSQDGRYRGRSVRPEGSGDGQKVPRARKGIKTISARKASAIMISASESPQSPKGH